jgi:hypothetical protein
VNEPEVRFVGVVIDADGKRPYDVSLRPRDDQSLAGVLLHAIDPRRWPLDQSEAIRRRLTKSAASTSNVSRSSGLSSRASA